MTGPDLTSPSPAPRSESADQSSDPAAVVEEAIAARPWITPVVRMGWAAKGVVYVLMGLTAFTIGRGRATSDDASPEGALKQVVDTAWGPALLLVLGIGLFLYSAWRLLSIALVRGSGVREWLDRVGFLFSATFYGILGVAAVGATLRRDRPEESNAIESVSSDLVESSTGRWLLVLGGILTIGVGLYFAVKKGVQRSFLKELSFDGASVHERAAVVWTGTIGWIGRGIVTIAVGWFVLIAGWRADGTDARGFDRALREIAATDPGRIAVAFAGLGLIVYGVFCFLSIRHMELES